MKKLLFLAGALFVALPVLPGQDGPKPDNTSTVARPRKKDAKAAEDELPPIPSKLGNKAKQEVPEGVPSFSSNSNVVSVDVAVLDNNGHFIPGIPQGNFRVLEDNVPQKVTNFAKGEAPITICMLVEFSNKFQQLYGQTWYQTLQAIYGFAQTLKPEDYVAVIAYDMKPEILSDFSTDRTKTYEALGRLRIAGFSEANLYDALVDTEERMKNIEGRKAILLVSSGIDTFSRLTFDKARKKLQEDAVPIYAIGLMQALRIMAENRMGPIMQLDFLQADNQMKTFAKETGGMSFFPRFSGEFPSIYQGISEALRNQYSLGYQPSNQAKDGTFRKIKVELVNPANGEPLMVRNEKGKAIKYTVVAKLGYTAPRSVE
jgi:Ca-activated chloride channel family protein